ncbi:MAG TPA: hypothetical protein VMU80_12560 [Bryobacteraceae bacterium]|nr:hypothetical protein [Bryobacteraceae bacterium]HUO30043.1 hypothetical protein [Bryobacteraceae bacterium]
MKKLRAAVLFLLPWAVSAADPSLMRLVMPDAKVLAGLQVNQAKNSLFGEYVLAHMQGNDAGFQKFVAQTGFDPRTDVSEIVMASDSAPNSTDRSWLIVAHGSFNTAKITTAAQADGATLTNYKGLSILVHSEPSHPSIQNAVTFLDSSTAAVGDVASVEAAIDRQSGAAPSGPIFDQAQQVSSKYDFWFVSQIPLSQFANTIPNANGNTAINQNILAGISQASGGISFGETVTITTQAVERSNQDAQSLASVVQFFASLMQMNSQKNPQAAQMAALLSNLQTSAAGNVTTISLAVPEQQLEQMLDSARQNHQAARRPAPRLN